MNEDKLIMRFVIIIKKEPKHRSCLSNPSNLWASPLALRPLMDDGSGNKLPNFIHDVKFTALWRQYFFSFSLPTGTGHMVLFQSLGQSEQSVYQAKMTDGTNVSCLSLNLARV